MSNILIRFKWMLKALSLKYSLRSTVQILVGLVMLYSAWQFINFYNYVVGNKILGTPYRPPLAESLLPFSGSITALKSFFTTGIFDSIHPAGLTILIVTWFTAWIFRRAFCSWICPIGTLVNYLGKLGHLVIGRNLKMPARLDKFFLVLRYFIGIYLLIYMFFMMNTHAFLWSPNYEIADFKLFLLWVKPTTGFVAHILTVVILCLLFKSFWCKYLCPYGAILGIFSLISPILLFKKTGSCIRCGKCSNVCPNNINIKDANNYIYSAECTGCTSCVRECPKSALDFKVFGKYRISPLVFSVLFLMMFFGVIQLAKITGHWESIISIENYKAIYTKLTVGK